MQLTTVMGVLIIGWSVLTYSCTISPFICRLSHPVFTESARTPRARRPPGWLEHFPAFLGDAGDCRRIRTLAASHERRRIARAGEPRNPAPKLKNLLRAGFVIFGYPMLLTSLISFLAVLIIPDGKRVNYQDDLNGHKFESARRGSVEIDYVRKRPPGRNTSPNGDSTSSLQRHASRSAVEPPRMKVGRSQRRTSGARRWRLSR